MNGFVKMPRNIWEWAKSNDPDHMAVWIYLMYNANWKDKEYDIAGNTILLKAGQVVTGRKKISKATGVNESKVTRVLVRLKKDGKIEQRSNSQCSIITMLTWIHGDETEQRVNSDRTASEQRVNTNIEGKKERRKEGKKELPSLRSEFDDVWPILRGVGPPGRSKMAESFCKFKANRNLGISTDQLIKYYKAIAEKSSSRQYIPGFQVCAKVDNVRDWIDSGATKQDRVKDVDQMWQFFNEEKMIDPNLMKADFVIPVSEMLDQGFSGQDLFDAWDTYLWMNEGNQYKKGLKNFMNADNIRQVLDMPEDRKQALHRENSQLNRSKVNGYRQG